MINPTPEQSSFNPPILPYPTGVDEKTKSEVRSSLELGKPRYAALGEIIEREAEELYALNQTRYRQHGERMTITEKTETIAWEGIELSWDIFGYELAQKVIQEAQMIMERNGEIENHPNFNEIFHNPDISHVEHVLDVMKRGDSGIITLLEEKLKEVIDPNSRYPHPQNVARGLTRGLRRYQELLDYFSSNH